MALASMDIVGLSLTTVDTLRQHGGHRRIAMEHTVFGAPSELLSAASSSAPGERHWPTLAMNMLRILEWRRRPAVAPRQLTPYRWAWALSPTTPDLLPVSAFGVH